MNAIFVAEDCGDHQNDLDRCLTFIDKAAEIGCAAVKFQLFRTHEFLSRQTPPPQVPIDFLPDLARRCRERGVLLSCTPYRLQGVEELCPHVDFFRIGSYELGWKDVLVACAQTGKPVVLSAAMTVLQQVREAVALLDISGCKDVALLHCAPSYPTSLDQCNLAAMATLRNEFSCPVGWSDHSGYPAVLYRAIHAWGAELIEFNLDHDGNRAQYATGSSWLPEQIAPVIRACKEGFQADGTRGTYATSRRQGYECAVEGGAAVHVDPLL